MQADPNDIDHMRTTLRNIRNHLSHDKESSVGDMVSRELRRAESWSRFQYAEVLQAANRAHRVDDVKRLRFIDPATLVATNSAEIPTLSEQLRKEASAHSRNTHRGEDGQPLLRRPRPHFLVSPSHNQLRQL
jgi:hypothetical protein